MHLQLVVLADAANVSVEGKLNIHGQFDTIYAASVPVTWPQFCYVARLRGGVADVGDHTFELRVLTEDGGLLATVGSSGSWGVPPDEGDEVTGNIILTIRLATFPEYGTYQFELRADDRPVGEAIVLHVKPRKTAGPGVEGV